MSAKDHLEGLFEKYRKLVIEYELYRVAAKAEIRRAERAGDEIEADRQRLEGITHIYVRIWVAPFMAAEPRIRRL